jgi:hypothetical protein
MSFRPCKNRAFDTTKDLVSRVIALCGGVPRVAHMLGKGTTQVYAYTDPEETAELKLDDARRLGVAFPDAARVLAEDFAYSANGCFFAYEPEVGGLPELLARAEEHNGKLVADIVKKLGKLDELGAKERAWLLRDCMSVAQPLLEAIALLRREGEK